MLEDLTGRFRRPGHIETMAHPLRKIFEYAVPGLAVFDPDGSVLDCNASFAAMTGRSREELQHTDSFSFVHPDDRERSRSDLNRLLEGQSPAFVIEKRLVRPDASIVWVRNSVSLIRDAENKPLQIVTIAEDMTMFRLAEQHELNNPLESIINLLFLISHGSDVAEMQHFAELAEQEMRRVAQIATQTLRFYRQQSAPAALHLGEVIDSVLALFEGRLYQRNVRVVKRFVRCDQLMIAYSGELRQVFVNLVSNALDAMNDHGVLHIDVRPSRNWQGGGEPGMRVLVCDSGSGIPRQMLQKIFEPFVSTKENQGTGLGLWISREIIRRHGGVLRVRSQVSGPRRGTAMSVFLPFPASDKSAILAA
jgi:PAS domain S-box-containing protein